MGKVTTVERFFTDVEERLKCTTGERRQRLEERLTLACRAVSMAEAAGAAAGLSAPDELGGDKHRLPAHTLLVGLCPNNFLGKPILSAGAVMRR